VINWKISSSDALLVSQIAQRAVREKLTQDVQDVSMDVTATHLNGNPLRLAELLKASLANFGHDITGIHRHLDRNTGKLKDYFSPRYSAPEKL
jgi:hypothetical protein